MTGARILSILLALGFLCLGIVYMQKNNTSQATVQVGDATVRVEIASSSAARERGLSGRASLPVGEGMLFVFDSSDRWGFWMKEMSFPIDIIWADEKGVIVSIAHSAMPESYPSIFYPDAPARFVLEVPAGFSASHHVIEGGTLDVRGAHLLNK